MKWKVKLRQLHMITGEIVKDFEVQMEAKNSVELSWIIGGAYPGPNIQLLSMEPLIEGLQKVIIVEEKSDQSVEEVRLDDSSVKETPTEPTTSPDPSKEFP